MQERLLAGDLLDEAEELAWINGRFRVPDLYLYLAGHAEEYAAIVFSPYLFWSTLYCTGIAPERTILMPCLHDEPYAYLRSVVPRWHRRRPSGSSPSPSISWATGWLPWRPTTPSIGAAVKYPRPTTGRASATGTT